MDEHKTVEGAIAHVSYQILSEKEVFGKPWLVLFSYLEYLSLQNTAHAIVFNDTV